jgi:hypothetical protein
MSSSMRALCGAMLLWLSACKGQPKKTVLTFRGDPHGVGPAEISRGSVFVDAQRAMQGRFAFENQLLDVVGVLPPGFGVPMVITEARVWLDDVALPATAELQTGEVIGLSRNTWEWVLQAKDPVVGAVMRERCQKNGNAKVHVTLEATLRVTLAPVATMEWKGPTETTVKSKPTWLALRCDEQPLKPIKTLSGKTPEWSAPRDETGRD